MKNEKKGIYLGACLLLSGKKERSEQEK